MMADPTEKLQMRLSESKFTFSRRMLTFFSTAEIYTVKQLTEIPLSKFTCFKGFKDKCMAELLAFIEFEQLRHYFRK
ncbi:hypothetical protein ABS768_04595 [Flavobacterium sp. ST-75]|uniref:Uncharacterized protein n=1 Tax=Flavobacterium rhizophilum TaxID=3163296 RepID=A0ABW8YBR3_9FLAO